MPLSIPHRRPENVSAGEKFIKNGLPGNVRVVARSSEILRIFAATLTSLTLHAVIVLAIGQVLFPHDHGQIRPFWHGGFSVDIPPATVLSNPKLAITAGNHSPISEAGNLQNTTQSHIPTTSPEPPQPTLSIPEPAAKPPPDNLPGPRYFKSSELHLTPSPISPIDPPYPIEAGDQKGRVILRLFIGENGLLDNVSVVESSPAGLFENSAITAFENAKFSPGIRDNKPVRSQQTIEIIYTPGMLGNLPIISLENKPISTSKPQ